MGKRLNGLMVSLYVCICPPCGVNGNVFELRVDVLFVFRRLSGLFLTRTPRLAVGRKVFRDRQLRTIKVYLTSARRETIMRKKNRETERERRIERQSLRANCNKYQWHSAG